MSSNRDLRVARAWVKVQQNWWAYNELQDAVENRPRKAWLLLGHLADLASTRELADDLGAGPLQDFIRAHAPKYIGQLERRASEHDRFRRAIRSVHLPRAGDPVSRRLLALGCRPINGGLEVWQRGLRNAADGGVVAGAVRLMPPLLRPDGGGSTRSQARVDCARVRDVFSVFAIGSGGLLVASACATWRVWPQARQAGTDSCAGIALAAGASAPAVLLCLAASAALLLGHLPGRWLALPRLMIVAATLGIIASPVFAVMSFGAAPVRSMSLRLECVRLGWILVWIATSWLVVSAMVAAA